MSKTKLTDEMSAAFGFPEENPEHEEDLTYPHEPQDIHNEEEDQITLRQVSDEYGIPYKTVWGAAYRYLSGYDTRSVLPCIQTNIIVGGSPDNRNYLILVDRAEVEDWIDNVKRKARIKK